jgi:hypothetical protein
MAQRRAVVMRKIAEAWAVKARTQTGAQQQATLIHAEAAARNAETLVAEAATMNREAAHLESRADVETALPPKREALKTSRSR